MLNRYERKLRKLSREPQEPFDEFCAKAGLAFQDNKKTYRRVNRFVTCYRKQLVAATSVVVVAILALSLALTLMPTSTPERKLYSNANTVVQGSNFAEFAQFSSALNAEHILDPLVLIGKSIDTNESIFFNISGYLYDDVQYVELEVIFAIVDNFVPAGSAYFENLPTNMRIGDDININYGFKATDSDGLHAYAAKLYHGESVYFIEMSFLLNEGIEDAFTTLFG